MAEERKGSFFKIRQRMNPIETGHCLLVSEGRRHTPEIRKYYPEEPPIKTIVLDNGDVFDCIDFYSQPAMKHASIRRNPQVHPTLFGDYLTRFFVFTANDTYKSLLYCDYERNPQENNHLQFVTETDVHLPLGSQLSSSVYDGDQTEIQIRIERNDHGNWDLFVDDRKIGFWPRENYNDGFPVANDVQWGGEIVNDGSRDRHTSTQMGSGKFSRAGTGKADYTSKVALYDRDNRYYEIPEPGCRVDEKGVPFRRPSLDWSSRDRTELSCGKVVAFSSLVSNMA
ncbi:hypothetical protein EJ110_NYTH33179 [Nymphaea thermarum]|nr:hypothetical protein EJ110_NYTH33179 [Nymphaea thermarum]